MKNLVLFCAFFLFLGKTMYGQIEILKTEKHTIEAQFDLSKNVFTLRSSNKNPKNNFLDIATVRFAEKEIQIDFSNLEFAEGSYYRLQMSASLDGVALPIPPENILGIYGKDFPIVEEQMKHTLVWTDLVEDFVELKGLLQITLSTEIYGNRELPYNVNCGERPEFTNKQKLPFLMVGIVGAGSLVTGQLFKQASAKEYAEYLQQETFEAGEPIRLSANDKHHKDIVFSSIGAALLAGDLIWLVIRQRRYKKQLNTYEQFCAPNEALSIRPVFEIEKQNSLTVQTGVNIKFRF